MRPRGRRAAAAQRDGARLRSPSGETITASHQSIWWRSDAMPASSARRGPRGTDSGIVSRICSYSASLRRCASIWSGASSAGSAPKKSLSSAGARSSRIASVGSARHSSSARAALVGDRVELAPAPAALALLGQVAGLGEALGLGVELGVLERPEVPHRRGDQLLEPVRRGLSGPARRGRARCRRSVSGAALALVQSRRYILDHGYRNVADAHDGPPARVHEPRGGDGGRQPAGRRASCRAGWAERSCA